MIRNAFKIGMLVLLMLSFGAAQAQFVTIKLKIPGGATFNSQVVDPMKGGSWEKSKAITWIEINVLENMVFMVDIKYPDRLIEPALEFYFLNNGTSNFEESYRLHNGSQAVITNKSGTLVRLMNPRPLALSAWLGLPMTGGIEIRIEYP